MSESESERFGPSASSAKICLGSASLSAVKVCQAFACPKTDYEHAHSRVSTRG